MRPPLNPLIESKLAGLPAICARHRVRSVSLFGSGTGAGFDPKTSDLDFLVEFESMAPVEHAKCYFGLIRELEDHFHLPVDVVEPQAIENPYFKRAIEKTRLVLYEAA